MKNASISDVETFYDKIMPLNYIIRYSNIPRIKNETVAEHSFLVAAIVIKLYDFYDFDLGYALQMAICHDMPEYDVNDVTHGTKKKYPELAKEVERVQYKALEEMPEAAQEAFWAFEQDASVEAWVVKLADILQCSQYAENEVRMGNSGYMAEIVTESRSRSAVLREKLKEFERCDS
jgi:5'-deoxynucleotidase YfbR-like HD superfamily hydrolase